MKVWMKVDGSWDHGVDEVPQPTLVRDIDQELEGLFDELAESLCMDADGYSDNLPGQLANEISDLLVSAEADEGTLFQDKSKADRNRAFQIFKDWVLQSGWFEYTHEWDSSEGSFYGIFLTEVA